MYGIFSPFAARIFLALAWLTAACATPAIHAVRLRHVDPTVTAPQGKVLVLGRVKVLWEGETVDFGEQGVARLGSAFRNLWITLYLLPQTEGPSTLIMVSSLRGDGAFYWHLPVGEYAITDIVTNRREWLSVRRRRLVPEFVVPGGSSVVYIGTLTISYDGKDYDLRIEDESMEAIQRLRRKVPALGTEVTKQLMTLRGPL